MKKILFTLMVLVSSCAPAYIPNAINAPLLNNAKETQISTSIGVSGMDIQTAIAVHRNIGIIANFNNDFNSNDTTAKNYNKHSFIELGAGFFATSKTKVSFEIFAGYGFGKVNSRAEFLGASYITKSTTKRIFLQPTIGFSSSVVDFAFTPRIVYVIMKPSDFLFSTINYPFIEPTGTLRLGYKYFFITSQVGISLPLTKTKEAWFSYQPFILNLGFNFKLFKIYDTKSMY